MRAQRAYMMMRGTAVTGAEEDLQAVEPAVKSAAGSAATWKSARAATVVMLAAAMLKRMRELLKAKSPPPRAYARMRKGHAAGGGLAS